MVVGSGLQSRQSPGLHSLTFRSCALPTPRRPTASGIHELGVTGDDGMDLMMNLGGRQSILSSLGSATWYGNLTLNVPLMVSPVGCRA